MKIIYVVFNDWNIEQVSVLASFGISVKEGYGRVDIEEGGAFAKIDDFLTKWNIEKSVGTLYDKKDIEKSDLLAYVSTWVNGYPQPEDVMGYLNLTYDLNEYCKSCGIGAVQTGHFRIKKEPKWDKKRVFELNWVFDEIFVKRELYESFFKALGIDYIPVLLHKKETIIESTVQLKLPKTEIPLLLENQPFEICSVCGKKKYSPKIKGFFPAFGEAIPSKLQIFKCSEFFGSSAAADNKIFITKSILNRLNELKLSPTVWPCSPASVRV